MCKTVFIVFGCGLSASASKLKLFFRSGKNWPQRVICRVGEWTEIKVPLNKKQLSVSTS